MLGVFQRRKILNVLVMGILYGATLLALVPLFSVFYCVVSRGWPAITLDFFTKLPSPVGEVGGGIGNAILGTATLVGMASLVGIPWGIIIGIYLSEYGRGRRATTVRLAVDILGSVPSIIIGLFVYTIMVIPMRGFSAYAGATALAILMVPTIARVTEEIFKLVPNTVRESGLALGLSRWKVILFLVLRGTFSSILTGVMLSVARIIGETAPLLFTALSNSYWQRSLSQPVASVPVQIYNYAISPFDDWHQKAWGGAFLLTVLIFILNLGTRMVSHPFSGRAS